MKSKLNTTLPTLGLLLVAGVLIAPNLSNAMDLGLNLSGDTRVDTRNANTHVYGSTTFENKYASSSDKFNKDLKNQIKTEVKDMRKDFRNGDDNEYHPGFFGRIWNAIVHRDKANDERDDHDDNESDDHDQDNDFWLTDLELDIDDTDATLSWSTSENATATVSYSTSTDMSNAITLNLDADDGQSIELENLEADTTYYYKIVVNSTEDDDDDTIVKTGSFTTDVHENDSDNDSDEDGPLVLWLRTALVTNDSARILWITPSRSTSKVCIESDSNVDTSGAADYTDSSFEFFHSVTVDALDENTTYYFKVASTDKDGNTTISTVDSFTTKVE
jgi:hypothetical protein